jgi:NDP-sugar pyrophosphorylase family protein
MLSEEVSDITAVIIAGGRGTRLQSVVADTPKALAEVCGRPFMTYLFDQLIRFRIKRAVLCTGFLGEKIQERFGNAYQSLALDYSREPHPLGTGGALKNAFSHFTSDPVLVCNGDSFCDADIAAFWNWHAAKKASASLLLTKVEDAGRYGKAETDADGAIVRFSEKGNRGPGFINAGVYIVNKESIFSVPSGKPVSLENEVFPQWIGRGLYGYRSEGRFIDIGTPEDYARASRFFCKGAPQ